MAFTLSLSAFYIYYFLRRFSLYSLSTIQFSLHVSRANFFYFLFYFNDLSKSRFPEKLFTLYVFTFSMNITNYVIYVPSREIKREFSLPLSYSSELICLQHVANIPLFAAVLILDYVYTLAFHYRNFQPILSLCDKDTLF